MENKEFNDYWYKTKPRVIAAPMSSTVYDEIHDIPTSPEVVKHMSRKSQGYAILLNNITAPQAHILKETMLSLDGDAAVHRMLIKTPVESSKVVVLGTLRQFEAIQSKMKNQPFAMSHIAGCVKQAICNYSVSYFTLKLRDDKSIRIKRPLVMGILNVTADSFSDGGKFLKTDDAYSHAMQMIEDGADMIDVGGESSRPGAQPIDEADELRNIVPVIEKIRSKSDVIISVDTLKPAVARAAINAGADILNDITGAQNPELVKVAADTGVAYIAMHMQGTPQTMQQNPEYDNVISDIYNYLMESDKILQDAGLDKEKIILDVGFGFGKNLEHNMKLIKHHGQFKTLGRILLAGISRKSPFKTITGADVSDRLIETVTAHYHCLCQGAKIIRVHDVKEAVKSIKVFEAIESV